MRFNYSSNVVRSTRSSRFIRTIKRFGILLLIFLVSGTVYLKYFTQSASAAWFDESWAYRQTVAIANAGSSVTDYQVSFTLSTSTLISAGKMLSSCNDIRVTDQNGKLLPLWIETGSNACNTTTTTIWTKVSSLPAGGVTLYVYYGNPSAQNIQSGDKVFEFFDDFSGNTLNPGKWTTGTISATVGTDFTVGSGVLSGGNNNRYVQSVQSFTGNYIAETRENTATQNANGFSTVGFWATTSNNFGILDHNSTSYYRNDAGWVNFTYNGTNQWNRDKVKVVGTSATYYRTGETSGSSTNTATNSGISGEYLRIGARYDSSTYNQNFVATWDFIFVRKAASTEPSAASPATEEKAPSPVAYWKFDGNLFDQTINKNHVVAGLSSTLTPNYVDGVSGSAIDFTTADWSTNLSYVSSTVVQDSTKSWTTDQWAGYTLVSNYEAVGGYCRRLIVSNTATNLTLNGTCNSWSGTKTYRIKKVMWVQDAVNYGTTNVTVEAWYRRTASKADANNTLVRFSGDDVGIEVYDTYITGYVDGYVNGFNCTVSGTDKNWHHVAISYDGATVKLYYDGKQCNTRSQVSTLSNNETVMIGTRNDGYSAFFEGYIDDFKIYPYTRSVTEVKTDFNSRGSAGAGSTVLGTSSNNNIAALSQGLVGYWKMNEATWSGTLNEVVDSSGNGNNGQAAGGTNAKAYPGAGKYGNGGVFDGVDDYVNLGNITSYKIDTKTISFWANPSVSPSQTTPVFSNGGANYYVGFSSSGRMMTSHSTAAGAQQTSFSANSIVVANEWHLYSYVFTVSGSDVHVSFYKDGTFLETDSYTSGYNGTYGSSFIIGAFSSSSFFYNGKIDDARIYNRALSPADVVNLYNFAPGPVGYWNLDEKSGTTASDISGYGNTGTLTNGPTWVSGKVGGAASFDGTNDYISIPDSGANDPLRMNGTTDLTVGAWVNIDNLAASPQHFILSKYSYNSHIGYSLLVNSSGTVRFDINGATNSKTTTTTISANKWYYITGVLSGGNTMTIYFNGIPQPAFSITSTTLSSYNSYFTIGSPSDNAGNTSYSLSGKIDEVKVYNYARTSSQIVQDMQGSRPSVNGRGAGTVGYWKFDEGYGTSAKDYSGNGNTGTLTSMASPATATSGWSNSGKFGKALNFDGSNDYVTMGDPASGIFDFGTSDFSISVWYNRSASGTNIIIGKRLSSAGYVIYFSGSTLIMQVADGTLRAYTLESSLSDLNTWHHIVTVVKRSTNQLLYYRDGILKNTVNISASTGSLDNAGFLAVGRDQMDGASIFSGLIDEVKIYSYALIADDVKKDFNRGSMQMMGSLGTDATGAPSDSSDRMYCPPGDTTATCGPVGEWNFEEGQGTSTNDNSGNGNAGTLNNNATWASGKVGKSVLLDGVGDYVGAGNASNLQLTNGTIEAWIKTTNAGTSYRGIVVKQYAYSMFLQNNLLVLYDWSAGTSRSTGINLADGNWHHVVAAFQSGVTNGTLLYIDGVLKLTTTMTVSNQTNALSFGTGASASNGQDFAGNIDQVKVYNYVRSAAQVAWDYNNGKPVAWWKMDECQGGVVNDSSGNGNTGTITIGATGTQATAGTCQTSSTAWGNGASGKVNSSLNFDGTDDYVDMNSGMSAITKNGTYSFSAWIKPTGAGVIFQNSQSCSDRNGMDISSTTLVFGYYDGSAWHGASGPITLNQWSHVVGVDNGGTLSIYINGNLQTGTTVPYVHCADTNLHIGRHTLDASGDFHGQIDDARVYNYALTSQQIKQLSNGGAIRFGPLTGTP